jgi:endothelin-converting enzyme/putative endopeptidase
MSTVRLLALTSVLLAGAPQLLAQPGGSRSAAATRAPAAPTQLRYGTFGIDLAARDTAVKPGDDFHSFASGTWIRNTQIPADRSAFSPWHILGDQIDLQLRAIVTELSANRNTTDQTARQVGDFYAAYMDEAGIEARGTAPLRPYLQRIDAVRSRGDLIGLFATPGYPAPIGIGILPDPANTSRYTAGISQGGLGMPDRDYYLKEGTDFERYRAAYRDYVIQVHRLAGIAQPEAKADAIIALERKIAEAHWTQERSRNIMEIYNVRTPAQLVELAPEFDWPNLLQRQGLGQVQSFIFAQPSAITSIGDMLESVPLQTWKDWMAFQFINSYSSYLPRAFDEASFNFYNRTLNGQQQQRDRWKRGIGLLNATLGEALGKLYVGRHYPPESQRQMNELVGNLRAAFGERLQRLEWMDDATRREALAKLAAFEPRIGHPTRWIDYSALRVDRSDPLGNMVRAAEFGRQLQISRLPRPVERHLWGMNAQTINASYNPLMNQITFPAGILQPPFFDPNADPAVNYGAIGAVIGHEIGHGFDDQGRRFDAQGRIRDWWTAAAAERYTAKTSRLAEQYNSYSPLAGVTVNGRLTMGENIGDLGGLEMAYAAYRRHVAQHGEPRVIDGLTGDQRFFLAWAQVWRNKEREDLTRQRILTDPHSPEQFRVNGVVRNMEAWYKAFNVRPGDRLYLPPEQRVSIW